MSVRTPTNDHKALSRPANQKPLSKGLFKQLKERIGGKR